MTNHNKQMEVGQVPYLGKDETINNLITPSFTTELFKMFVKRAKENLHILIAMSPLSDSFRSFIVKFPALMSCCTINWMHQWPGKNQITECLLYKRVHDTSHFQMMP